MFVASAGYRLEGIKDAADAAEWAWERGWDIGNDLPAPPAPDIRIESNTDGQAVVNWTDVTGIDPDVDGYKIWRAAQYQQGDWLATGMRIMDQFHHQHEVGASTDGLLDAVNPYFDAEESAFSANDVSGTFQPEEWGTYELVAKIPANELSQYATSGGPYAMPGPIPTPSSDSRTGTTSPPTRRELTGPQGNVTVGHIESYGTVNRNGRNSCDAADGVIE